MKHKFVLRHDRLSEWGVSFINLFFGLALLLPMNTLNPSDGYGFLYNLHAVINDWTLGTVFFVLGCFRLTALYINGTRKFTPKWRVIGSTVSASLNSFIGLAFLTPLLGVLGYSALKVLGYDVQEPTTPANTAAMTYLVLAWLDYYSAGRAGFDNGIIKRSN